MKRIKRQWARVRFNPEAKLRHERAVLLSRPMMIVRKGMVDPSDILYIPPRDEWIPIEEGDG